MSQSPQYSQSRKSKSSASTGHAYQETDQELGISGEILVATILDNPSEDAVFENDQIKEQHEIMILQNENFMLKNT